MIEKLSGTFRSVRSFECREELTDILRSYVREGDDIFRLHIYSDDSDELTIIYLLPWSAKCARYLTGSRTLEVVNEELCINGLPHSGYVEVYSLNSDQYSVDLEIFDITASVMGVRVGEVLTDIDLTSLGLAVAPQPPIAKGEEEGKLPPCCSTLQSLLTSYLSEMSKESNNLSKLMRGPYLIGKILLEHEEYYLHRVKTQDIAEVITKTLNTQEHVAIKLEADGNALWLLKLGNVKGVKIALDGTRAPEERLEPDVIEKFLTSTERAREVLIHEYRLGKKFIDELNSPPPPGGSIKHSLPPIYLFNSSI